MVNNVKELLAFLAARERSGLTGGMIWSHIGGNSHTLVMRRTCAIPPSAVRSHAGAVKRSASHKRRSNPFQTRAERIEIAQVIVDAARKLLARNSVVGARGLPRSRGRIDGRGV
jgi:hypothetical protein